MLFKMGFMAISAIGLPFLAACNSGNQATTPATSPASPRRQRNLRSLLHLLRVQRPMPKPGKPIRMVGRGDKSLNRVLII